MADTIRIIGTTTIYLIHPDSKQPTTMTFHVASSEGSVLLSCNASLNLSLICYRPRLDYLPPQSKLNNQQRRSSKKNKITSSGSETSSYNQNWKINTTTPKATNYNHPH